MGCHPRAVGVKVTVQSRRNRWRNFQPLLDVLRFSRSNKLSIRFKNTTPPATPNQREPNARALSCFFICNDAIMALLLDRRQRGKPPSDAGKHAVGQAAIVGIFGGVQEQLPCCACSANLEPKAAERRLFGMQDPGV
jgi:hypothetical protein